LQKKFGWRDVFLVLVTLGIIALDQYTKSLVRKHIPLGTSWNPVSWLEPFVTFTHTQNTGIAFGLFPGVSILFIVLILLIIVAVIVYYKKYAPPSWLLTISFGLLVGGALGNLIDRLTQNGNVTDFINVRIWAVFNIADSSIVVGALLLSIYGLFLDRNREEQQELADGSQKVEAS
jgi:signal peptidase II